MKRMIIIILSLISLIAEAQEIRSIGASLLNDTNPFEEIDSAVLNEGKVRYKELTDKGMMIPGALVSATSESIGKELGSIVRVKESFLVRSISFTVTDNQSEGCRASIGIYRMNTPDSLESIVTMPVYQDIPAVSRKTRFEVVPEEIILLEPGDYYISFSIDDLAEGSICFPLYMKGSYYRTTSEEPLKKCSYNIGISVRGSINSD